MASNVASNGEVKVCESSAVEENGSDVNLSEPYDITSAHISAITTRTTTEVSGATQAGQ